MQDNILGRWQWLLDPIHGYTIKGTYHFLTSVYAPTDRGLYVDVWHKRAPLKVSLFAWRLFCNQLLTKDNLVRRHVLDIDDNVCVGGCGSQETANHLLFCCDTFLQHLVLDFSVARHLFCWSVHNSRSFFFQFGHLAGLSHSSHSFFQIIWLTCVWVVWKEQNSGVFQQKVMEPQSIADKVKRHSFLWLKSNMPTFVISYHDRWRHPLACMGVLL